MLCTTYGWILFGGKHSFISGSGSRGTTCWTMVSESAYETCFCSEIWILIKNAASTSVLEILLRKLNVHLKSNFGVQFYWSWTEWFDDNSGIYLRNWMYGYLDVGIWRLSCLTCWLIKWKSGTKSSNRLFVLLIFMLEHFTCVYLCFHDFIFCFKLFFFFWYFIVLNVLFLLVFFRLFFSKWQQWNVSLREDIAVKL